MAMLCAVGARLYAGPQEDNGLSLPDEERPVRVFSVQEGDLTRFYVRNDERCEVTMTFELRTTNLDCDRPMPLTGVYPPRQVTPAFTLTATNPAARWKLQQTNFFKLGNYLAEHDNSVVYQLPYQPGNRFQVTQAYDGAYSHQGANRFAIDWKMPEGTPVCAARGGVVAKVRVTSDRGGDNLKYDRFNNFIMIRHDDGTLGHYCHLQKNGATVKPGQRVEAGEVIGRSGNTGFSSGPHLHFAVVKPRNGLERESLPVQFRTSNPGGETLVIGETYGAPANTLAESLVPARKGESVSTGTGAGSPVQ